MPGSFYNNIKGVTSGAPGTGAFTPSGAASGGLAWSTVPTGWMGLVRFEDGPDWELQYSYWNGTTLSRSATSQFVASSTGSGLTLTSAATAAMVVDAADVQSHLGGVPTRGWVSTCGQSVALNLGTPTITATGTAATASVANTNYLSGQQRLTLTSATTANAQAGWNSTTTLALASSVAGQGGWEYTARFGCSVLPTGPRMFVGMIGATYIGQTIEPSAYVQNYAGFAKDSTDTNIQLLTNSNAGGGTKIDTGIPLVANGWYEATIWSEPGSLKIYALLMRLDTGAIWFGSTTTDVPVNGTVLREDLAFGLSGTTGTGIVVHPGQLFVRGGS